ncbi:hypothetical protein SUGI_1057080 [Cryptomeria japonica]|nr:hypothetical protein SUGI_1057080 [Cryptomeria japonica]
MALSAKFPARSSLNSAACNGSTRLIVTTGNSPARPPPSSGYVVPPPSSMDCPQPMDALLGGAPAFVG